MNIKPIAFLLIAASTLAVIACGGGGQKADSSASSAQEAPAATASSPSDYDPKRGEGKFDASNVTVGPLDQAMATKGESKKLQTGLPTENHSVQFLIVGCQLLG